MKSKFIVLGILLCCILLYGCSTEKREHDSDITVKDSNGNVLYRSKDKSVMEYFADLVIVDQLDDDDVNLTYKGEVLYEYTMRDNDKVVSFFLYEPGNVLSCGVGSLQVYYKLPDNLKEELMHPGNWMVAD